MYLVRLLAILLALGLLSQAAGCGKQEQAETKKDETKTSAGVVHEETLAPKDLKGMEQGAKSKTMDQWQALSEERQTKWDSMSEEEKQALREKRRLLWDSMTEEEKQALREERQARWDSMSEDEKQALREKGIKMKSH